MGIWEARIVIAVFFVAAAALIAAARAAAARRREGPEPTEPRERVRYLLRRGRRLAAVKVAREVVGGDLSRARAYVERVESER